MTTPSTPTTPAAAAARELTEAERKILKEIVDLFEILSPGQIRFLGASLWGGSDGTDENLNEIWDEVRSFADKADAMITAALEKLNSAPIRAQAAAKESERK